MNEGSNKFTFLQEVFVNKTGRLNKLQILTNIYKEKNIFVMLLSSITRT